MTLKVDADHCFPKYGTFEGFVRSSSVVGVGKRGIGNCSLQATVIHRVLHVPLLSNECQAPLAARYDLGLFMLASP
jgi:hypothetical protein